MRVPKALLRETIVVADYAGQGARGPSFADGRTLRANVQPSTVMVTDINGVQVNINLLVTIRPEDGPVPVESKCVTRGITYRVVRAYPMPDERRPSQWELMLSDYAAPRAGGSGS